MDWNVFFMGVNIGVAILCFAGRHTTTGLLNAGAAALNAIVVFT